MSLVAEDSDNQLRRQCGELAVFFSIPNLIHERKTFGSQKGRSDYSYRDHLSELDFLPLRLLLLHEQTACYTSRNLLKEVWIWDKSSCLLVRRCLPVGAIL